MPSITLDSRLVPSKQYVTPTTGSTVTVNTGGAINLVIDPAGTLATLTVTFPSSPSDGDVIDVMCTQIVTALTMNGGTIVGGLSSFAVGSAARYRYNSDSTKWIG